MHESDDAGLFRSEEKRSVSVGVYVVASLTLHGLFLALWASRQPIVVAAEQPRLRYVELSRPAEVTEAVGRAVERGVRSEAPLSNANRRAGAPEANLTGDRTLRPGSMQTSTPSQQATQPATARPAASQSEAAPSPPLSPSENRFEYRVTKASAAAVDWNAALKAMTADPVTGGGGGSEAGEGGYAESAPLSFESQWYPWGDYSDHMIRRIRQHWHANMPQILRTGIKGVATIRFTIERSGRISDITILESSGVPPYDFAAKKAIELSSPLKPLPADFPGASERVTARFFYNMRLDDETPAPRS